MGLHYYGTVVDPDSEVPVRLDSEIVSNGMVTELIVDGQVVARSYTCFQESEAARWATSWLRMYDKQEVSYRTFTPQVNRDDKGKVTGLEATFHWRGTVTAAGMVVRDELQPPPSDQ